MASKKVQQLIDIFRSQFQKGEAARIPLALRSEPVDVVFTSLLEEDAPTEPPLMPLLGVPEPVAPQVVADAMPSELGDALGMGMDVSMAPGAPEMPQGGSLPQGAPQEAAGGLEELLAGF